MSVINWGIIGLGKIAEKFALAFKDLKNSKLISVASRSKEKIEKFQNQFKLDHDFCYNDYEKILLNQEIDVIYIALPHSFHFEWIMKCIDNKKNVLTEKPATVNHDEIVKINNSLNKNKIFFAEGFMYRFHPQTLALIETIKQGEIGELHQMDSFFGKNFIQKKNIFGFKKIKINNKNRLFKKDLGGGSILDLGCYPSSLSILIASLKSEDFSKKIKLSNIKKIIGPTDVDLEAFTNIEFNNGFSSFIGSSFKNDLGKNTKIIGSKGKIIVPDSWHCENSTIIVNGNERIIDQKYINIFSYEIESISSSLLNNEIEPKFPAIKKHETELNMNILNRWINSNEK